MCLFNIFQYLIVVPLGLWRLSCIRRHSFILKLIILSILIRRNNISSVCSDLHYGLKILLTQESTGGQCIFFSLVVLPAEGRSQLWLQCLLLLQGTVMTFAQWFEGSNKKVIFF